MSCINSCVSRMCLVCSTFVIDAYALNSVYHSNYTHGLTHCVVESVSQVTAHYIDIHAQQTTVHGSQTAWSLINILISDAGANVNAPAHDFI